MLFHKPYKPVTSHSELVKNLPNVHIPKAGSSVYENWVKNLPARPEQAKIHLLRHLSVSNTVEQLKELNDIPAEWLNLMFEDVARWGSINGELVESFFQNFIETAENNPHKVLLILSKALAEQKADRRKFRRSISHIWNSIDEKYPSNFGHPKNGGKGERNGLRYAWTYNRITEDLIRTRTSGTDLVRLMGTEDYELVKNVILALTCIDRVGAKGSPYTQKDYDRITHYWEELVNSEIKVKANT